MKKKVVSALLCATMVATMFAGCGSKESDNNASTPDTSKADTSSEVSEPAEDTGKVLNISEQSGCNIVKSSRCSGR